MQGRPAGPWSTARGEVGPLHRKLESYGDILGLVVGAFGEGSEGLHKLAYTMARMQGLFAGREGSEAELGVITGQVRRNLSTTSVQAKSLCLLARLDKMREGGGLLLSGGSLPGGWRSR